MRKSKNLPIDFSYYNSINKHQEEFHESIATNKLLVGGYRAGKTYPAIHEALFICLDNANHQFLVCRNTWDSLKENVEDEFVAIAKGANAVQKYIEGKHNLFLKNGTKVMFRPLTMSRAQFKGMNLCGFLLDDPNIDRFKEVISFLYTRLTNPHGAHAKYFATIICANYEGHDWLWQKYIRRRKEGDGNVDTMFAYWWCSTEDNPTLPDNYIAIQASIHSKNWMDRYIYCKQDTFAGLVYDEYNPVFHDRDLSWCEADENLLKILVIDLGITHPTVVLKMATDYKNVYIYGEWYKTNIRTATLGEYLIYLSTNSNETFHKRLIDPKSNAREQQTGISPRQVLRKDFGIQTTLAINAELQGIEIVKGLLTVRDEMTHLFVDPSTCPNTVREMETFKWATPMMSDFEDLAYKEKVKDEDNDCMDCVKYGGAFFKKLLRLFNRSSEAMNTIIEVNRNERLEKLKVYRDVDIQKISADRLRQIHNKGNRDTAVQARKRLANSL